MNQRYYIAYGSNLNLTQMKKRCPTATCIGTSWMKDYRLLFKGPKDDVYLTIEPYQGSQVPVALWLVSSEDEKALDSYEDYPMLYNKQMLSIEYKDIHTNENKTCEAFIYIMNPNQTIGIPSKDYVKDCLEGYRCFGFDESYLNDALKIKLRLVKASKRYQNQIVEMLTEWKAYNDKNDVNTSPAVIFKYDFNDFDYYTNHLEITESTTHLVPNSVYFCLDESNHKIVGAVDIRHQLNDYLLLYGGHIGDGIRPSERKKGYATKMLNLALDICHDLGINEVLLVCDKKNEGSKKSIIYNGGILENEVIEDGNTIQRYWIKERM